MTTPTPPRWILRLLRAAAGPLADDVEGDLHEWTARWARDAGPRRARLRAVFAGLRMAPGLWVGNVRRNGLPRPASMLDLRLALRLLWRQPGLSLTSVIALAVTMAMAITAWTVASQAIWGELDVQGGDRLFVTRMADTRGGRTTYPTFAEIERMRGAESIEALSAFTLSGLNVAEEGSLPRMTPGSRVDANAFPLAGGRAELGRLIDAEDIRLGRDVTVLSHALWSRRFGSDPDMVGRTLEIEGRPHEVIGIAEEGFSFPVNQELWVPLHLPAAADASEGYPGTRLMGRLRPGATRAELDAELARRIEGLDVPERSVVPSSVPYTHGFMSPGADIVFLGLVFALVGLVAVAAANVANLILARTEGRVAELAVRTALGASRTRVVGQLFLEVLALTTLAAALGLAAAATALGWLRSLITELPYWIDMAIGLPVIAFSLLLALSAAVVAGALPALRATGAGMSDGLRRTRSRGFGRLSGVVIVAELAVTVGLLAGSLAMGRALLGYQSVDFGLPENEVLTAQIAIPIPLATDREDGAQLLQEEVDRLQRALRDDLGAVPGIRAVGFSTRLPGEGGSRMARIQIAGSEELLESLQFSADAEFYEALGIQPVAGRVYDGRAGREGAPREVLVNQPFVDLVLRGRNPIGQQVRTVYGEGEYGEWAEIVGLIPDIGVNPGDAARSAAIHRPLGASNYLQISIRTAGDPGLAAAPLRAAVHRYDPAARVTRVTPLSRVGWETRALLQGLGGGLLVLGLVALLLSSAGLWAVLAFSVSRRTREIGVRVALGATPREVLLSVAPRTAIQVVVGLVLGCGIAWGVLQGTGALPISIPDGTILYMALPSAALMTAAVAATLRPIRRALSIRPAEALRQE